MSIFEGVSSDQLVYISATMASLLSKGLNNSDINILSSVFSAIGDNLGLIAARNEAEAKTSNTNTTNTPTNVAADTVTD